MRSSLPPHTSSLSLYSPRLLPYRPNTRLPRRTHGVKAAVQGQGAAGDAARQARQRDSSHRRYERAAPEQTAGRCQISGNVEGKGDARQAGGENSGPAATGGQAEEEGRGGEAQPCCGARRRADSAVADVSRGSGQGQGAPRQAASGGGNGKRKRESEGDNSGTCEAETARARRRHRRRRRLMSSGMARCTQRCAALIGACGGRVGA